MNISMLKGKIHRATVKQAELDYVGSITVDPVLLEAAGILEYEHVHIVDVNNGSRFETYTIPGEPGSGMILTGTRNDENEVYREPLFHNIRGIILLVYGHKFRFQNCQTVGIQYF